MPENLILFFQLLLRILASKLGYFICRHLHSYLLFFAYSYTWIAHVSTGKRPSEVHGDLNAMSVAYYMYNYERPTRFS